MVIVNGHAVLDASDCSAQDWHEENIEHKCMILKPEMLSSGFNYDKYQLVYIIGGYGCDPTAMGTPIFYRFLFEYNDGEQHKVDRTDEPFYGIAKDNVVLHYAEKYHVQ